MDRKIKTEPKASAMFETGLSYQSSFNGSILRHEVGKQVGDAPPVVLTKDDSEHDRLLRK